MDRNESQSVWLLFAYGFGNAATYSLARTVADSTYLAQIGTARLAELYLLSAGVVAMAAILYGAVLPRLGLRRTIVGTLILFATSTTALAFLLKAAPNSLALVTIGYFLAQIRGSLGTIHFATVLNEQFGKNRPERIVGIAGAGATVAGFSIGIAIGALSDFIAVENFLFAAAILDFLTIAPLLILRIAFRASRNNTSARASFQRLSRRNRSPNQQSEKHRASGQDRDGQSSYVALITTTVVLCILATTMVEYQWKVTAVEVFPRTTQAMTKYFGYFYGVLYLMTGMMQLFLTSRLLRMRGIKGGLIALPLFLLAGSGLAIGTTTPLMLFIALNTCKFGDIIRRALHDPSVQITYAPIPKKDRRQAITFVSGVAKPFAEALAGALIVLLTNWISTKQLSIVVILLCCVWLGTIGPLNRARRIA
ncbi:MAG: MFS transporter [Aureliella sp.]